MAETPQVKVPTLPSVSYFELPNPTLDRIETVIHVQKIHFLIRKRKLFQSLNSAPTEMAKSEQDLSAHLIAYKIAKQMV